MARAIHLCICDVLYKKITIMGGLKNSCDGKDDCQNEDDDSDKDCDDFENGDFDQDVPRLVPELGKVVSKVRKIVKLFRKSPVRNDDNLQPQIKLSFGKEKALFLDCKTRLNSLLQMLKRFYELRKEVRIVMVQLDQHSDISDEEFASFMEKRHQTTKVQDKVESSIVKKEMSLFEATKKRPENLQKLFNALLAIKSTSVEPEWAFSAMGLFATKLRSQLGDETLDALIVMRQKFKK